MNYLEIVNDVLVRLRESEVSSVTENDYSTLIGKFVNDAKREVEDAWNWTSLRTNIPVTTSSGTSQYTLTGAGDRSKVLHVINDTQDLVMQVAPYDYMKNLTDIGNSQNASPVYYNFDGASSGDPQINVWPIPDGTYTLNFYMVVPQSVLTTGTTELTVPYLPVALKAYAKALSERGEDGSTMYGEAEMEYRRVLSDYIAMDASHVPHELLWTVW